MDAVVILQTDAMLAQLCGSVLGSSYFYLFFTIKDDKKKRERAQRELYFNVVMLPSLKTHQTPDD